MRSSSTVHPPAARSSGPRAAAGLGLLTALVLTVAMPPATATGPTATEPGGLTALIAAPGAEPAAQLRPPAGQPHETVQAHTEPVVEGADVELRRVAGNNRIETALRLADFYATTNWVVLARHDDYADALAGAPLAAALEAPILLTPSNRLDTGVEAEIRRLEAGNVALLGGTSALSSSLEQQVQTMGVSTERVAGADRFATASKVADLLTNERREAFLVEGRNADPNRGWPDAVSVSAYAAARNAPILLTDSTRLPDPTRNALDGLAGVSIVGGPAAVSTSVEREVEGLVPQVLREAGPNRYATSFELAEALWALTWSRGAEVADIYLATGRDWPDALAAGPIVAAPQNRGGTLLLIDGQDLDGSPDSATGLWDLNEPGFPPAVGTVYAIGGEAVIPDSTMMQVGDVLADPSPPTSLSSATR